MSLPAPTDQAIDTAARHLYTLTTGQPAHTWLHAGHITRRSMRHRATNLLNAIHDQYVTDVLTHEGATR